MHKLSFLRKKFQSNNYHFWRRGFNATATQQSRRHDTQPKDTQPNDNATLSKMVEFYYDESNLCRVFRMLSVVNKPFMECY